MLTAAQIADFPHGVIGFGPNARAYFMVGATRYYADDWSVWRNEHGSIVYRNNDGLLLWVTHYNGQAVSNTTTVPALANQYLADPAAWQTANNAHRHDVETSSGGLAHAIGGAIHSLGNVVLDTVEFSGTVALAALHPLTIDNGGLALSNEAHALVPDLLEPIVDPFVQIAGYGVLAGAAVTAIGGIGAVETAASSVGETVSGVAGAVGGLQQAAGALGLLPAQTAPPLLSPAQSTLPARSQSSLLAPLIGLGLLFWLLKSSKGHR